MVLEEWAIQAVGFPQNTTTFRIPSLLKNPPFDVRSLQGASSFEERTAPMKGRLRRNVNSSANRYTRLPLRPSPMIRVTRKMTRKM